MWFSGVMTDLALDLWGDVTDPWSYVAKRQVEAAVAASERPADVVLIHHVLPGSAVAVADLRRAAAAAAEEGVDITITQPLDLDTTNARRLVALALTLGGPALQGAMLERLYAAVFVEGLDVSSPRILQRLGGEAGLDEHRVADVLATSDRSADLDADVAAARNEGIARTPYLVVDHCFRLAGPASVQDYLTLLARAAASSGTSLE